MVNAVIGDLDLIQRIAGSKSRLQCTLRPSRSDFESISCYDVELPLAEYRSFPPSWKVLIYNPGKQPNQPEEPAPIIRELRGQAEALLRTDVDDRRVPILIVSTSRSVKLAENMRFDTRNVFFLEALDLENKTEDHLDRRYSLLVMSARKRLTNRELAKRLLRPYTLNRPATGWKFFGRSKELELLVESDENVFVCGARKIGKTSLLRAAEERLIAEGYAVHFVSLENVSSIQEVASQILGALSERERYRAANRSDFLNEPYLESVMRSLIRSSPKPIVLLLDEFGNVIERNRQTDWQVVGLLRKFSQASSGRLRIIMSGFQEFAIKQFENFDGPYVNFATLIRLRGFSNAEIRELIIAPLEFWGARVVDADRSADAAASLIGRHPMLLQYLGSVLFERLLSQEEADLDRLITYYSEAGPRLDVFDNPIRSMLETMRSSAQRYIFIRACWEADEEGKPLSKVVITEEWVESSLASLGYKSTFDGRRLLLESLELHGFTTTGSKKMTTQTVTAPIVYKWLKRYEDITRLLFALSRDIDKEASKLTWS